MESIIRRVARIELQIYDNQFLALKKLSREGDPGKIKNCFILMKRALSKQEFRKKADSLFSLQTKWSFKVNILQKGQKVAK